MIDLSKWMTSRDGYAILDIGTMSTEALEDMTNEITRQIVDDGTGKQAVKEALEVFVNTGLALAGPELTYQMAIWYIAETLSSALMVKYGRVDGEEAVTSSSTTLYLKHVIAAAMVFGVARHETLSLDDKISKLHNSRKGRGK